MSSVPFEQTLTSLQGDVQKQRRWFVVMLLVLLCGWLALALWVPIPIQLTSSEGGIVSAGASVRILSTSDEPVRSVAVKLGQRVAQGDVILQFSVEKLQLDLRSKQQQLLQQASQISAVESQQRALTAELADEQRSADREIERLNSKLQQTDSKIEYARTAEALYKQLRTERRIDRLQYEEASATLAQELLERDAISAQLAQAVADRTLVGSQTETQRAALAERHALLTQQATDIQREVAQLERQILRSTVRAPTDCVVGDLAQVAPGASLPTDQWAMTLIPVQPPEFRALFSQRLAGGQVQQGQQAQVELFAFPWVEHGTVPARVVRVGHVATNGLVEVIFSFDLSNTASASTLRSQIQQGLQGRVRVQVGATTLLQRFLQLLSSTAAASTGQASAAA